MDDSLRILAQDLSDVPGVAGSVIVASDGTVLAQAMDDDPEKEGAVAVFVGNAAGVIGDILALGGFEWGVVTITKYRMLIVQRPTYFIGLLMTTKASPAVLAAQVDERVGAPA